MNLRKAAEMALVTLEEKLAVLEPTKYAETIEALRQALAQPEQEPLVWMNKYGHVSSEQTEEYNAPLYTAPPKREWVGLTIDEVLNLLPSSEWKADVTLIFSKAIEAKLKEKNA